MQIQACYIIAVFHLPRSPVRKRSLVLVTVTAYYFSIIVGSVFYSRFHLDNQSCPLPASLSPSLSPARPSNRLLSTGRDFGRVGAWGEVLPAGGIHRSSLHILMKVISRSKH